MYPLLRSSSSDFFLRSAAGKRPSFIAVRRAFFLIEEKKEEHATTKRCASTQLELYCFAIRMQQLSHDVRKACMQRFTIARRFSLVGRRLKTEL